MHFPKKPALQKQKARRPVAPPVFRPQPVPKVLQKKAAPVRQPPKPSQPQSRVTPKAPPVYRPQVPRAAVQPKMAATQSRLSKTKSAPAAPPVYRPQALPKVLQRKSAANGPPRSGATKPASPKAPPVYRPQPIPKVLQKKVQPGAATGAARTSLAGAPKSRQTIQRYCEGRPLPDFTRKPAANSIKAGRQLAIQRKVGFEVEMSVPTFGKPVAFHPEWFKEGPDGTKAPKNIEIFLFGGLPYGADIGENANFRLTSDHNDLQRKSKAILNKLHEMGYLLGYPAKGEYKNVSNLEYVSPALDELAPNSTTAFQTQFNAMRNHMQTVWTDAKTKMKLIPDPAAACATGVPVAEFKQWLGDDYKQIEGAVTEFQDAIKDDLYLQATVGVIPSALRDLHRNQVPESDDDKTHWHHAIGGIDAYVDKVVNDLIREDDPFVKDLESPEPDLFKEKVHGIETEAFKGELFMILMYMVGNALNQTEILGSSSAKNAVPFLSKMNLGQIQDTAMTNYQRGFIGMYPPEATIKKIIAAFKKFKAVKVENWVAQRGLKVNPKRTAFIADDEAFIRGVLTGKNVTAINTGRSRQLTADTLPKEVADASAGQKGVTVEYRHISESPTPGTLGTSLMKIVREVRELNTKHLPPLVKKRIIDAADK